MLTTLKLIDLAYFGRKSKDETMDHFFIRLKESIETIVLSFQINGRNEILKKNNPTRNCLGIGRLDYFPLDSIDFFITLYICIFDKIIIFKNLNNLYYTFNP